MRVKYVVIYERAPNNYCAYAPDLPGCVATGATLAETEAIPLDTSCTVTYSKSFH